MKAQRAIFWILVLLFIILPCWWVFHFPFRPELVFRVIPHEATVVTRHVAPADRWLDLARSPAVTNIATALGADAGVVANAINSDELATTVGIIGSRYVTLGFVPAMGANLDEAVVFGAWIGGYSQLMRWGLLDKLLADFSAHRVHGNQRIWLRPCHEIKPGYTLSLIAHEGVLAGCLSTDPLGVMHLLPQLRRQLPTPRLAQDWVEAAGDGDSPDAFRAVVSMTVKGQPADVVMRGNLTEVSSRALKARLEVERSGIPQGADGWLPFTVVGESVAGNKAPFALLSEGPCVLMATPVSRVDAMMRIFATNASHRTWPALREIVRLDGDAYLFACGGEFYGRMMRMKVPAAGLVVELRDTVNPDTAISGILDVLNAAHGWGLVATPDPHDPRIRILDSVRSGSFRKLLGADERPAIAVCDRRLLAMSNVDVLRRILGTSGNERGVWASRLGEQESALYGWANLADAGDLMIKALAGYTLASLMQPGDASQKQRHDTAQVKAMIKAIGELEEFAFWLQPGELSSLLVAELTLVE